MGKVVRARQKFHLAAVKAKSEEKRVKFAIDFDKPQVDSASLQSNIFSGVDIKVNDLVQCLPSFDKSTEDVASATSTVDIGKSRVERLKLKNTNISKKEKIKLRHMAFLQKIQVVQEARKKVKASNRRQQTAITRDLQPLLDSLPDVDAVKPINTSSKSNIVKNKPRCIELLTKPKAAKPPKIPILDKNPIAKKKGQKMKTFKQLQKQMLADLETFRQVKEHSEFKEKPEATILKHLHYKFKYSNT